MRAALTVTALTAAALMGCVDLPSPEAPEGDLELLETRSEEVVYGVDNRTDVYAHPDANLRTLARNSIGTLVRDWRIDRSNPNDYRFNATRYQDYYGMCTDQRFLNQPVAGYCSGTLIDYNLFLTAGHCIQTAQDCAELSVVFNYEMRDEWNLDTVTQSDVYHCSNIVVQAFGGGLDYAIVRLDRSVTGHQPAPVSRTHAPLTQGAAVTIIGAGMGLPMKIDNGGRVVNNGASHMMSFMATVDAFGGNSGSGVFDSGRNVVGVLSGGNDDLVSAGSCNRVAYRTDGGETIGYAYHAVDALCASGYNSPRLCPATPVCGDGLCEGGETCTADCGDAGSTGTSGGTGGGCAAELIDEANPIDASYGLLFLAPFFMSRRRRARLFDVDAPRS